MVEITEPDKSVVSTADVSGSRMLSGDVLPLNKGAPDKKIAYGHWPWHCKAQYSYIAETQNSLHTIEIVNKNICYGF